MSFLQELNDDVHVLMSFLFEDGLTVPICDGVLSTEVQF
jgi:hypothetical protein